MPITESQRLSRHYFVRGLILGLFTLYIVHLVRSDRLQYYIAPRMMTYVKFAALALFVLAVYLIYEALSLRYGWKEEGEEDCECGHAPSPSVWRNLVLYGLFAAPLILGFVLPDKVMGSDVVAVKGMNLGTQSAGKKVAAPGTGSTTSLADAASPGNESNTYLADDASPVAPPADNPAIGPSKAPGHPQATGAKQGTTPDKDVAQRHDAQPRDQEQLKKLFPYDEYSEDFSKLGIAMYHRDLIEVKPEGFLEVSTMLDMYMNNFIGKKIAISGFIYREPDMKPDQFVVSRLAMSCCSADAAPYGFLVTSKQLNLKKDTWIHLTGLIGKTNYDGNTVLQITAKTITIIRAPKDPYVYPFNDDITRLAKN